MKVCYDLHIHSCLSPCGDDDMTPNNIVNMALLAGLDLIALTDHNSCKNCPALLHAAKRAGLKAVCGMELCTAEECHVICLFPTLQAAMEFDALVEGALPPVMNKPEVFGAQTIMDGEDVATGFYPVLLSTASSISVDNVAALVKKFGGTAFPSHIDRPSFSVISVLGTVPDAGFQAFEISARGDTDQLIQAYPQIKGRPLLLNSDAHTLSGIQDRGPWLELAAPDALTLIKTLNRDAPCSWGR